MAQRENHLPDVQLSEGWDQVFLPRCSQPKDSAGHTVGMQRNEVQVGSDVNTGTFVKNNDADGMEDI